MVRVVFTATLDGTLTGVNARGHANSDQRGRDIVCASISVLLQSLWLGLTQVLALRVEGTWSPGRMHVHVSAENAARADVRALFQTLFCSLEALAAEHPRYLALQRENPSSK